VLGELRQVIKAAAPEADEVISYRIPLYKHRGDLVGFGAFKNPCSLFVMSSELTKRLAAELEPFEVKHTTVHFTVKNTLSATLVKRIVEARIAENEAT
jgi:uncharacterized protein YdhG (YjbR/CyaY superfamily)